MHLFCLHNSKNKPPPTDKKRRPRNLVLRVLPPVVYLILAMAYLAIGAFSLRFLERKQAGGTGHGLGTWFYYQFITITTVGYGDIVPQSGVSKAFAGCWMVFGLGGAGVVVGGCASFVRRFIAGRRERLVESHNQSLAQPVLEDRQLPFLIRHFGTLASVLLTLVMLFGGAGVFYATENIYYTAPPSDTVNWSYSNAVWFSAISLFTVGYGDLYVRSTAGMVILPFYLVLVLGIASLVIGEVSEHAQALAKLAVIRTTKFANAMAGMVGKRLDEGEPAPGGSDQPMPAEALAELKRIDDLFAEIEKIRSLSRANHVVAEILDIHVRAECREVLQRALPEAKLVGGLGVLPLGGLKEKEALMRRNLARLEEKARQDKRDHLQKLPELIVKPG
jgi:hypothetical protein